LVAAIAGAAKEQARATTRIFRIAKSCWINPTKYQNPPEASRADFYTLWKATVYIERGAVTIAFTAGFVPVKPQFRANDDEVAMPASA
jgi:hypothetical protein